MDLLEKYLEQNRMHSFEGYSGVRRLETLINDIGDYSSSVEFLADNSGAIDGIVEFIQQWSERNAEWKQRLQVLTDSIDMENEDDEC